MSDATRGKLIPLTILLYSVSDRRTAGPFGPDRTTVVQACSSRIDGVQEAG